ncbi:MAG: hypothetical protein GY845_30385 [Planctomycetes bacterium]|nr:hypothetical protein [Planctomycetota bacterium]
MRPKQIEVTMATADRNGISVAQTTAGAANLTITGAYASGGVATTDVPRHVSIYSSGNLSGVTFTVTGTDRFGNAISEAITGPSNATVIGLYNFKTITQVAASGAVGTNVEVGTANALESQWIPVGRTPNYGVMVVLSSGASLTYSVHYTPDDVFAASFQENDASPLDLSTDTTDATTTQDETCTAPMRALRLEITGFSSGTATFTIIPASN